MRSTDIGALLSFIRPGQTHSLLLSLPDELLLLILGFATPPKLRDLHPIRPFVLDHSTPSSWKKSFYFNDHWSEIADIETVCRDFRRLILEGHFLVNQYTAIFYNITPQTPYILDDTSTFREADF